MLDRGLYDPAFVRRRQHYRRLRDSVPAGAAGAGADVVLGALEAGVGAASLLDDAAASVDDPADVPESLLVLLSLLLEDFGLAWL
jgi:hypothetical protein